MVIILINEIVINEIIKANRSRKRCPLRIRDKKRIQAKTIKSIDFILRRKFVDVFKKYESSIYKSSGYPRNTIEAVNKYHAQTNWIFNQNGKAWVELISRVEKNLY